MECNRGYRGFNAFCGCGAAAARSLERHFYDFESGKMKHRMRLCLLIVMATALTGCTFGNGMICGPQTPLAYCNREAYQRLAHPKPYLENWEKSPINPAERSMDSANCGGGSSNNAPNFSQEGLAAASQPGEKEYETRIRLHHNWERCMLKKGYRFSGECYNNQTSRAKPACGAP